ncbi:FMRFamide receptor-like [Mercenaria mercenaria]|uniref:FMRFamide receptor-like n=1 Tax=Mercenaria mercenaria TaxID=6596 RepID=UPI00234F231C|nr:FMRFamide receptor-like [Mercenaria mercenaria]
MSINETGFPFDDNFSNTSNVKNVLYDIVTQDTPILNITQHSGPSSHHAITSFIEKYVIPVICILGLIGNTVSSVVFLRKPLRNSSCSIFLAARGFSDNGFLSTLLIIWISRTFQLHLGKIRNSCQIIIFLTYVCGCASVWLVVFVTIENYIRICRPFIVNRVCTTNIAKLIVGLLSFVTICIYNFPFWTMNPDNCIPYVRYHNTVQALVYTDTLLTLVVPLICMTLVMTAITCSLVKSYNRRSRLRAPTAKRIKNPMAKVTKMLFAVSMTFFCLNLPSHINRLRIMISSLLNNTGQHGHYSSREEAIQQITLLVYYLSLATNLIVYISFGSKFRNMLREMFNIPKSRMQTAERSKSEKEQELTPIINQTNTHETQSERTDIVPLQ